MFSGAPANYRGGQLARLGTRTADLLHVAAALELGSDWFYSFDRQQRKLAQAAKLNVQSIALKDIGIDVSGPKAL